MTLKQKIVLIMACILISYQVPLMASADTLETTSTGIDLFSSPPGNSPAKIVADNHNLMLRPDGRLLGWGDNTYGQLGLGAGTPTKVYTPTEITFFADKGLKPKDIAVIEDASFVLCSNGETYSTGKGLNGRLGLGDTANRNEWTLIPGSAEMRFNKLYPGKEFIDVTTDDNRIFSWGRNNFGQVGNGTKSDVLTPVKIMDNADVKELDVGEDFVTLIKQDNSYWTWGNNALGRYGFDTSASKSGSAVTAAACINPTPTACTATAHNSGGGSCTWNSPDFPRHETCAGGLWDVTEAGYQGTKGAATLTVALNSFTSPQTVVTGAGRVFPALGTLTTAPAGTADGITNNTYKFKSTANCTHTHNYSYRMSGTCLPASKSTTRAYTHTWQYVLPNAFAYFDTSKITKLQLGNKDGVACIDGTYYSWGDNSLKQQGETGHASGYMVPSATINNLINTLNSGDGFGELIVAKDTKYILTGTGKVFSWGGNQSGKAGVNSSASYIATPTAIPELNGTPIANIVSGRNHALFLTHGTGDLYTVGDNLYGQTGLGEEYADETKIIKPLQITTFKFAENMTPPDAPDEINAPDEVEAETEIVIHWPEVASATEYELVRNVTPKGSGIMQFVSDTSEVVYSGDQSTFTDTASSGWNDVSYLLRARNFIGDYSPAVQSNTITVLESSNPGGNNDGDNNNNNGNNSGGGLTNEQLQLILDSLKNSGLSTEQLQLILGTLSVSGSGLTDKQLASILSSNRRRSGDVIVTVPDSYFPDKDELISYLEDIVKDTDSGNVPVDPFSTGAHSSAAEFYSNMPNTGGMPPIVLAVLGMISIAAGIFIFKNKSPYNMDE